MERIDVVGIIPVYNESDIVEYVVDHLIEQGVKLIVLDNGSTDGSYEICSRYLGKGILTLDRLVTSKFELQLVLKRLQSAAMQYSPGWILLCGADEFLESPYNGLTIAQAITLEDSKGYNVIQFNNFEFWPTELDESLPEKDPRKRLRYYSWLDDWQFRCFKAYQGVTIHESGGHVPKFPEGTKARISPNKFILRHYKIRSCEQGLRKVFAERLPRYSPQARTEGWHVQYDNFQPNKSFFVIDSRKLTRYDEDGNWNLTRTFDGTYGTWIPPTLAERTSQLERQVDDIQSSFIYFVLQYVSSWIVRFTPDGSKRGELRRKVTHRLNAFTRRKRNLASQSPKR